MAMHLIQDYVKLQSNALRWISPFPFRNPCGSLILTCAHRYGELEVRPKPAGIKRKFDEKVTLGTLSISGPGETQPKVYNGSLQKKFAWYIAKEHTVSIK